MIGQAATLPQPVRFYAYVVVDRRNHAVPLTIKLSRKACRDFVDAQPNAPELRIRRVKALMFDS